MSIKCSFSHITKNQSLFESPHDLKNIKILEKNGVSPVLGSPADVRLGIGRRSRHGVPLRRAGAGLADVRVQGIGQGGAGEQQAAEVRVVVQLLNGILEPMIGNGQGR